MSQSPFHRRKANEVIVRNALQARIRWTPPLLPLVILTMLVVGLNAFDGYATLHACRTMGAVELNPVMAFLLSIGPSAFMSAKTLGVALALSVLAYCLHHPRVRDSVRKIGWGGLIALSAIYFALCVWHVLVMTGTVMPPEAAPAIEPVCVRYESRPR